MTESASWMGVPEDHLLPKPGNLPRFEGRAGWHEVWYATTNHRPSGTGLWFRYTLTAPPDPEAEPTVTVWGFAFGADGPRFAGKATVPLGQAALAADGGVVRTPQGEFAEDRLSGELRDHDGRTMTWNLRFDPSERWTSPLPSVLERAAPSFYGNPNLDVAVRGTVEIGDERLELDDEPMGQSHIWGRHHAGRWAWTHLRITDGFVIEALQARPHLPGPLGAGTRTAPFALVRVGDEDHRFLPGGPMRARGRFAFPAWYLVCEGAGLRMLVTVQADAGRFIQVTYHDPDGTPAYCTNTEVADAAIEVQRLQAGGWRTTETYALSGSAHIEFGDRRPLAAVPVAL